MSLNREEMLLTEDEIETIYRRLSAELEYVEDEVLDKEICNAQIDKCLRIFYQWLSVAPVGHKISTLEDMLDDAYDMLYDAYEEYDESI